MGDCASITSWNKCKPTQNGRNGHYIQDLLVLLALIDQLGANVIQPVCKYAKYVKYAEYVNYAYYAYYMIICIICQICTIASEIVIKCGLKLVNNT